MCAYVECKGRLSFPPPQNPFYTMMTTIETLDIRLPYMSTALTSRDPPLHYPLPPPLPYLFHCRLTCCSFFVRRFEKLTLYPLLARLFVSMHCREQDTCSGADAESGVDRHRRESSDSADRDDDREWRDDSDDARGAIGDSGLSAGTAIAGEKWKASKPGDVP